MKRPEKIDDDFENCRYEIGYAAAIEDAAKMLEKDCSHMDNCDDDKCGYAIAVRALLSKGAVK
jgi:hypothetical protein